MLANLLAERRLGLDAHAVNLGDDVALAQTRLRCGSTLDNRCHIYAANLADSGILAHLVDEILVDVGVGDAEQCALHQAVLLQVDNHLAYDALRHGERVADVAARRGFDDGVDADQLTSRIDQRATRIARIYRSVGLDERLDAELARDDIQRTCLGGYDARRDGRLQVEWRADSQHPLAQTQRIRTAELQSRKCLGINLNECDIRSRVAADDAGVEFASIVEFHAQLGGVLDNVVVGDYVAILRDDYTRAARTLLALLWRTLLGSLRKTEELEEGVEVCARRYLNLGYCLDIHYGTHGILCGVGQVGILLRRVCRKVRGGGR